MSNSLQPHGLKHTRPPCPSPTPGVYSNSCPLSQWCHPTISSSVIPFSSCLQSFPASESFQMSQFFASGSQSIGISALATVLTMNILEYPNYILHWGLIIFFQISASNMKACENSIYLCGNLQRSNTFPNTKVLLCKNLCEISQSYCIGLLLKTETMQPLDLLALKFFHHSLRSYLLFPLSLQLYFFSFITAFFFPYLSKLNDLCVSTAGSFQRFTSVLVDLSLPEQRFRYIWPLEMGDFPCQGTLWYLFS